MPASAPGLGEPAPSERIAIGMIGAGDHGIDRNLPRFLPGPDCRVVAVHDVGRKRRTDARRRT